MTYINKTNSIEIKPLIMQLFIKTLSGTKQNFNFEPDNTILQIKTALQEKEGILIEQIKLIYGGKQLADENKICDYKLEAGSTLHMVLQLRGGK